MNVANIEFTNFVFMLLLLACLFSDAIDIDNMLSCLGTLKLGEAVSIPNYDFVSHRSVEPARMVLNCLR